jgi:hypothetical protein
MGLVSVATITCSGLPRTRPSGAPDVTVAVSVQEVTGDSARLAVTLTNGSAAPFTYSSSSVDRLYPLVEYHTLLGWRSYETLCDTDTAPFHVAPGAAATLTADIWLARPNRRFRVGVHDAASGTTVWSQPLRVQPAGEPAAGT